MFYKKQTYGTILNNANVSVRKTKVFSGLFKNTDDVFIPPTVQSLNWIKWSCVIDKNTCVICLFNSGRIFRADKQHHNCRCVKIPLQATPAGYATNDGLNGADYWLKNYGILPNYYISDQDIEKLG